MSMTDLGFLFLLLPVAVAFYYCIPDTRKAAALLVISLFFLLLIDRRSFLLLGISVAIDCAALQWGKLRAGALPLLDLCIAKHLAALLLCGIALPWLGAFSPMPGVAVVSLSAIELLVGIRRGRPIPPAANYAAAALFFGRLPFGPTGRGTLMLSALRRPTPSLSGVGRGTMLIIAGVAKQVVISREFLALFRTLSHLPPGQMALASIWFYALCCALGLYFVLSGLSDVSQGIGLLFSLSLTRTVYYPLQARSLRDYLYRINMPLEDTVRGLLTPGEFRESPCAKTLLLSALMPLLLGFVLDPSGTLLPWSLLMCAMLLLDAMVLRWLPAPSALLARAVTFVVMLPSYLLLLPVGLAQKVELIGTMFGVGSPVLVDSSTFYLLRSNLLLLLIGLLFCSSFFDRLGRMAERQLPRFWWLGSAAGHLVLLVIATSFLLWNVR